MIGTCILHEDYEEFATKFLGVDYEDFVNLQSVHPVLLIRIHIAAFVFLHQSFFLSILMTYTKAIAPIHITIAPSPSPSVRYIADSVR